MEKLTRKRERSSKSFRGNYGSLNRRKAERQGIRKQKIAARKWKKGGTEKKFPEIRVSL